MTETMTMEVAGAANGERAVTDALRIFAGVRNGTMRAVASLTEEQAGFRPNSKEWSVAQILDHLLLTEGLYRTQMSRMVDLARQGRSLNIDVSLSEVDLSLPFIPKALMPLMALPLTMMNMFVPQVLRETVLRFPVMKAKNPKISEPAAAKSISLLREELAASLAQTEACFAGTLPTNASRVTVSHPVFGRNTIANVFGLMAAHEERHGSQISSLLRDPAFPAGGRF